MVTEPDSTSETAPPRLYVYTGSLVTHASELLRPTRHHPGIAAPALYWGGLAATVLATLVITRLARRALHRALGPDRDAGPAARR